MPGACELMGTEQRCCWGTDVRLRGIHGCWHPRKWWLHVQPDPGCLHCSVQIQPSMENPWASVPLSTHCSPAPVGRAEGGFGPSSCHLSDSSLDTELSTRVLAGPQSRSPATECRNTKAGHCEEHGCPSPPYPRAMHWPRHGAADSHHFSKYCSSPLMALITLLQLTDLNC